MQEVPEQRARCSIVPGLHLDKWPQPLLPVLSRAPYVHLCNACRHLATVRKDYTAFHADHAFLHEHNTLLCDSKDCGLSHLPYCIVCNMIIMNR